MINQKIKNCLAEASKIVGNSYPLYSFVTSNPLSGFEKEHFSEAAVEAEALFSKKSYPAASLFIQALERGEIFESEISDLLQRNDFMISIEESLNQMKELSAKSAENKQADLDRILSKWLAAFLDEGLAEWEMPDKNLGFYRSWRKLAKYDTEILVKNETEIPASADENLAILLNDFTESDATKIMKQHLAALPGWTGYIKHRTDNKTSWQKKYPISLMDYLAVRLFIAKRLNIKLATNTILSTDIEKNSMLPYVWLQAWESSWQKKIAKTLQSNLPKINISKKPAQIPDAQFVLCIDTRSELMRRHIENAGNYETFGYAGFFGIAMDYKNENTGMVTKACPPILESNFLVQEHPKENKTLASEKWMKKVEIANFKNYFFSRLKNMLPSAFGYVEGSGLFYGISLIKRTLFSGYNYRKSNRRITEYENVYEPAIKSCTNTKEEISLNEKAAIVKSAFDLTGWKNFAQIVVFVGHGSHSTNNPFGSSLDCGACAASPGRHNARMLAKLANSKSVQEVLKKKHQINIPSDTVFIGAEHNTTTDEIVLFDADCTHHHNTSFQKLRKNLQLAQKTATKERFPNVKKSIEKAQNNANNWSETRPEWGLAKNAGLIIGPRSLTKNINLEGRCFLHSYDWELDKDGSALEGIMQGPMVVTQLINNHYYFSTVDNNGYGGGSKLTHNITGRFGVVQGNGGDLKFGLPLESVKDSDSSMYHQPLRLSVIIHAPINRVETILHKYEHLANLINNEWIYLMVIDPDDENKIKKYRKDKSWITLETGVNLDAMTGNLQTA